MLTFAKFVIEIYSRDPGEISSGEKHQHLLFIQCHYSLGEIIDMLHSPHQFSINFQLIFESSMYLSVFVLFSVRNLHDRWSKACGVYRDLYGQLLELSLSPSVDWSKLLSDKQVKSPPSTSTVNKTLLSKHQTDLVEVKQLLFSVFIKRRWFVSVMI